MDIPQVVRFFDKTTLVASYIIADPVSGACAIVDPVLDFDPVTGRTGTRSADALITHVVAHGLRLQWILETHLHEDHVSAAQLLRRRLGGRIGIGARVLELQGEYAPLFDIEQQCTTNKSPFDNLFDHREAFPIGELKVVAWHTPGHTCTCTSYLVGNAAFVGDTLLMPAQGTARTDLCAGDARRLHHSIRDLLELAPETRLFHCHDYRAGRQTGGFRSESSVAEQRVDNVDLKGAPSEDAFVALRQEHDRFMPPPPLLLLALQINLRAGAMPPPQDSGRRYLKIPVDAF